MAILTSFPGLDVDIIVDGNALQEYDIPANSSERATDITSTIRYIEAQPGQEFDVRVRVDRHFRHLRNDVPYVVTSDGEFQRSRRVKKENYARGAISTMQGVKRSMGGKIVLRKCVFSTFTTGAVCSSRYNMGVANIAVDDRPVNGTDAARASKLGEIVVSLHRTRSLGTTVRKKT